MKNQHDQASVFCKVPVHRGLLLVVVCIAGFSLSVCCGSRASLLFEQVQNRPVYPLDKNRILLQRLQSFPIWSDPGSIPDSAKGPSFLFFSSGWHLGPGGQRPSSHVPVTGAKSAVLSATQPRTSVALSSFFLVRKVSVFLCFSKIFLQICKSRIIHIFYSITRNEKCFIWFSIRKMCTIWLYHPYICLHLASCSHVVICISPINNIWSIWVLPNMVSPLHLILCRSPMSCFVMLINI
jgi:hypothetical protein